MTELERLQGEDPCKETGIEVKHVLFRMRAAVSLRNRRVCEGQPGRQDRGNAGLSGRQWEPVPQGMPTGSISTAPTAFKRRCMDNSQERGQFERSPGRLYREIAARLKQLKAAYGPESVLFYSGYAKWYRSFLQPLPIPSAPPTSGRVLHLSHGHSGGVEGYGRHLFRLRRAKRSHLHGLGGQSLPLQTDSAAAALPG